MTWRSGAAAVAIVAGAVAVAFAGPVLQGELTATTEPVGSTASATQRVAACPGLAYQPEPETVAVGVLPTATPGTASLSIDGNTQVVTEPGGGEAGRPVADGQAATITATAGFADLSASTRELLDRDGEGRGLAIASCVAPAAEFWFAGVASLPGRIDEILLANPTPSAAVVSVTLLGPDGEVSVPGSDGMVVQPGGQGAIRVDSLVQGLPAATIHLTTTGGVVAAQLRSTSIDGLIPQGAAYLPPAGDPAELLVLPGIPAGEGQRLLVMTAPKHDVAVDVALIPAGGAARPLGEGPVAVPAGSTVAVDLTEEWGGEQGAISLAASGPLVAAARSQLLGVTDPSGPETLNRVPVADYAWVAGVAPVAEESFLPVGGAEATTASVYVAAVNGPAEVTVGGLVVGGDPLPTSTRTVAAGTVEVIELPPTAGRQAMAVVTKNSGAGMVFAAVLQRGVLPDGPVVSAWPAQPRPPAVAVPVAYPDPEVLTGR